jgi:GTP-binding protein YchF
METGLIGLPSAGKTTIFSALAGGAAAGTGGGRKSHIAEVAVPDQRIGKLWELFPTAKRTYATVVIRDLAVQAGEKGALTPAALAEMRTLDALALVIRAFLDPAVPHPLESVDPARDLRRLLDALTFADYAVAETRLERIVKEGKKSGKEYQLLEQLSARLAEGGLIAGAGLNPDELRLISGFSFLTAKPLLLIVNEGESTAEVAPVVEQARTLGLDLFVIHGRQEMEIAQLPREEQLAFLADLGLEAPTSDRFLRQLYHSLHLISFLTAGEKDVRAWSLPRGSTALKAAGRIHTDLEKGFIRAEAIAFEQLMREGGFAQARKSGTLRLEGKEYVVQDGDVLTIRFNL